MVRAFLWWSVWGTVGAHTLALLHALNAAIVLREMKAVFRRFGVQAAAAVFTGWTLNATDQDAPLFSFDLAIFPHLSSSLFTAALPLPPWFGEENMLTEQSVSEVLLTLSTKRVELK